MTLNAPPYLHLLDRRWATPRWRMSRKMRGTLITIGLLCGSLPCVGIGHRKRQPECITNLKSLFTGLRVQPRLRVGEVTLDSIGFSPERGNRYAYFLGEGPMEDRSAQDAVHVPGQMAVGVDTFRFPKARALTLRDLPPELARLAGPQGTSPDAQFVALCAGDGDDNPMDTPDIWSIATMDRVIDGEPIASGEPYNHVNDKTTD